MLDRAAAADTEVLAYRCDPLRAWMLDAQQLATVRMISCRGRNVHRFAAKSIGHKETAALGQRDAVAEMADMIDEKAFNHGGRR